MPTDLTLAWGFRPIGKHEDFPGAEAAARLAALGPNALPEPAATPLWRRFVRQFASPLIYILLFALAFDLGLWIYEGAHGWPIEAIAIGLILLFNAALGLYQEQRSEAALARLKALAGAQAWVLRDGQLVRLPTQDLVPGDSVRLEAGDRVPADGTLIDAHGAMLDESILTGESVAVDKSDGDEAFSGTLLVRGKSLSRGDEDRSHPARWAAWPPCSATSQAAKTPLERRVDQLGPPDRALGAGPRRRRSASSASLAEGHCAARRQSSSSPWRWPWPRCPKGCRRCSRWPWRSASSAWPGTAPSFGDSPRSRRSGRSRSLRPTRPAR